jgi:hypothetical protein
VVARNNLVLAKRIFEIMEGPGIISDLMDSDANTHHPGTINFPHRLAEAKRIHNENLIIASRLDAVQPTYYDKSAITAVRRGSPKKGKHPARTHRKKLGDGLGGAPGSITQHSVVHGSQSEDKPPKSKNVLLEYSKVQKGRVLDVAVIKEPFRDSYSIFGIDIDNGQRYELKLSSEEVSNILEGDILVTNVDNVEVWMALIAKVELLPVEAFSKTPLPNAAHMTKSETKKPSKPTALHNSKQQSNPRMNKMLKVTKATTDSSVGSSSAVNGAEENDDISLTTGGGDENQTNEMDHENGAGGEEEDSTKGYTLDEYYENHAPLSPLPSQTGFVTSAPSGRQRMGENIGNNFNTSPSSQRENTGNVDDDGKGKAQGGVASVALTAVSYILDTAVKNILINSTKVDQSRNKHEQKRVEKATAPTKKENPYTSTRVTTRSNSIQYTSVQGLKDKTERVAKKDGEAEQKQPELQPPSTPGTKVSPTKEPHQPKDAPPPENSRRPVPRQRSIGSAGSTKRKPSNALTEDGGVVRKQSRAVDNPTNTIRKQSSMDNSSRKKSGAVVEPPPPLTRRISSFRRADPMAGVQSLCPKVADLAIKSALKRFGDIVDLFNLEIPES